MSSLRAKTTSRPVKFFGMGLDDLFAYEAPKLVEVRDAKLGCMNYVMMFLIFLYVIIYQVVYNLGYLRFLPAHMTVRLSLKQPTIDECNPLEPHCHDNFPEVATLPYCCKDGCTATEREGLRSCRCPWLPKLQSFTCEFLDGVRASDVNGDKILVQTRFSLFGQQRRYADCNESRCSRRWEPVGRPESRFVAGIENFTMMIDHSLVLQEFNLFKTNTEMQGWLEVPGTDPLQRELCKSRMDAVTDPFDGETAADAPCFIKPRDMPGKRFDIFYIQTLLLAMGISLDDRGHSDPAYSRRAEGFTVMIKVHYMNTRPVWGVLPSGEVVYVYRLVAIPNDHYKQERTVWTQFPDRRTQLENFGILFSVVPAGQLGQFDLHQLLVTFTTSVALLALCTLAIKHLSTKLLAQRDYYRSYLIESSVDFSDIRYLEEASEQQLDTLLKKRDLPLKGTRKDRVLRLLNDGFTRAEQSEDGL